LERYRHTQIGWVTLTAMAGALIVVGASLQTSGERWIAFAVFVLLFVAIIVYSSLTVTVTDDTLEVRFGPGLIRKEYRLVDIESTRVVRNHWYYGFGTRLTPHGWLYNVSGLDAVEIQFKSGKKRRIGTDEPRSLNDAIQQAARLTWRHTS